LVRMCLRLHFVCVIMCLHLHCVCVCVCDYVLRFSLMCINFPSVQLYACNLVLIIN
jgi:hypothetical protein